MIHKRVLEKKPTNRTEDTEKINKNWRDHPKWEHAEKSGEMAVDE